MITFVLGIIFTGPVDLDGWVLGVDLPLDEALQGPRRPDVEPNLPIDRSYLKTQMFLRSPAQFELMFITQDAVQTGE